MHCVITDFGLSRFQSDVSLATVIAVRWSSPELFRSKIPDKESDVWALGNKKLFCY